MDNLTTPVSAASAETDALDASFDIIARQDQAEADIIALRGDVNEVRARLDKVARAATRPVMGGAAPAAPEVKSFVDGYLRLGRETEVKSINGATPADGGFAVPRQIDVAISSVLAKLSPIRSIAQVVQTGSTGYRKLIATSGCASGWVSETAARPETSTPQFAEIAPPSGDLYANPAASQVMLDDNGFNLETWLANEVANEFARAEGVAFIRGTGINQPEGFLTGAKATTEDSVRAFGTMQYLGTGSATGLGTSLDTKLIDLIHSLRAGHRQGAVFVMNSTTLASVRKLKTADGAFVWQPGLAEGQPNRLFGYPVVEAEDMPDVAGGAFPIAFGNFRNGYLIAERSATRVLRDPFTNKPFVHFYTTKRIGGKVLDSNAIKLLKIEA